MQSIEFSDIEITGGYWKTRQDINSEVTLKSVYERFRETHRFDALKCGRKDGDPVIPDIFWDSDVAKWLEGAAYILNSKDDESIAEIIENGLLQIVFHHEVSPWIHMLQHSKIRYNSHQTFFLLDT